MSSTFFTRTLPCLAVMLPLLAGCPADDHSVGSDDTDSGTTGDSGKKSGPDAGTSSGCEDPNPGCCGVNSQGCSAIVAEASCLDGAWTCPTDDTVGPVCDTICAEPHDGGAEPHDGGQSSSTFICGDQGLTCDSATQYCYISEGGVAPPDGGNDIFPSCKSLPSSCETAPTCACIEAVPGNSIGSCTKTGDAVTLTIANP